MKTLWCKNQENPSDRISHAWAPSKLISRVFKCVFIYTIAAKVSFDFINQKVAMIILIT
jgi:hypothetical protein